MAALLKVGHNVWSQHRWLDSFFDLLKNIQLQNEKQEWRHRGAIVHYRSSVQY